MMWEHASLIGAILALAAALFVLVRAKQVLKRARDLENSLQTKEAAWQAFVASARREAERLETALKQAEAASSGGRGDALSAIADLGDPAALADANRLANLAEQLPAQGWIDDVDLFGANSTVLEAARLADQGHPPQYIAKRLGLSLGDVELLLSLRSA